MLPVSVTLAAIVSRVAHSSHPLLHQVVPAKIPLDNVADSECLYVSDSHGFSFAVGDYCYYDYLWHHLTDEPPSQKEALKKFGEPNTYQNNTSWKASCLNETTGVLYIWTNSIDCGGTAQKHFGGPLMRDDDNNHHRQSAKGGDDPARVYYSSKFNCDDSAIDCAFIMDTTWYNAKDCDESHKAEIESIATLSNVCSSVGIPGVFELEAYANCPSNNASDASDGDENTHITLFDSRTGKCDSNKAVLDESLPFCLGKFHPSVYASLNHCTYH